MILKSESHSYRNKVQWSLWGYITPNTGAKKTSIQGHQVSVSRQSAGRSRGQSPGPSWETGGEGGARVGRTTGSRLCISVQQLGSPITAITSSCSASRSVTNTDTLYARSTATSPPSKANESSLFWRFLRIHVTLIYVWEAVHLRRIAVDQQGCQLCLSRVSAEKPFINRKCHTGKWWGWSVMRYKTRSVVQPLLHRAEHLMNEEEDGQRRELQTNRYKMMMMRILKTRTEDQAIHIRHLRPFWNRDGGYNLPP